MGGLSVGRLVVLILYVDYVVLKSKGDTVILSSSRGYIPNSPSVNTITKSHICKDYKHLQVKLRSGSPLLRHAQRNS